MGKLIEKYSDEVYSILAKAAIAAQKPLGDMYIKIYQSKGYVCPNNKALFISPQTSAVEVLTVEKLVASLFERQFENFNEGGQSAIMSAHKVFLEKLENKENRLTLDEVSEELDLEPSELEALLTKVELNLESQ